MYFYTKGFNKEMMEKSQKIKYNACIQFGYYSEEMPGLDVPSAPDKEFYDEWGAVYNDWKYSPEKNTSGYLLKD